jgi:hypothetical protein
LARVDRARLEVHVGILRGWRTQALSYTRALW